MKQTKRIIGAVCLLVLFIAYRASITAFVHVHYVDGGLVTHSHPFHGTHSHTKTSFLAIEHLSVFNSFEAELCAVCRPMHSLLAVIGAEPATPALKGEVIRALSLRAPPQLV